MAIAVSSAFGCPPWTFRVAAPRRVADSELTRSAREFVLTKAEVLDIVFCWQNLPLRVRPGGMERPRLFETLRPQPEREVGEKREFFI
jgi:hypothetical protein